MRSRARRLPHILLALVVLAAALRFWRIGHQSYWLDESFTVHIVRDDFGGMLDGVRHTESTPPLYYALAWLWERVSGWHEEGLRSLSALFGVATVPVAFAAAREAFSHRAALIAAALVAVNPYFVWYSQEARAYALLVLLSTVALLYFLRAERDAGDRRSLWLWALAGALALLTHYFAAFLLVPEAAWLLYRHRARVAPALGALVAVGAALLPLALAQRDAGHTLFITDIPFGERLAAVPKKIVTGELGTPTPAIGPLAGVAVVAGLLLALFATRGGERRGAWLLAGLAGAVAVIALALKLAGQDYFFARNTIEVFIPIALLLGAGFAAVRPGALGAATVIGVGLAVVVQVSVNPSLQRDDWRGLARALGPARAARALVLTPEVAKAPLGLYARGLGPLPSGGGALVRELDLIAGARPPRFAVPPAPAGFRLASVRRTPSWELVRYVTPRSLPLAPPFLASLRLQRGKDAALLLQRP
ncbi:MAG: mannosyltransferase [Thermoleophilaceae bacterium]|nr:mannosyltransferase [Thermoleophilaceae bacterium]